jgi:hypothetical protein
MKPLKPHLPTAVVIPPRPLTSPPRPYKRHHTPPHPHPQHFAAFLIVSLGSKLIVREKKPPLICLYVAGLPQSPHHPPKPLVSFASLPSPSFSSRSELSEPIESCGESSSELLSLRHRESTMDRSPGAGPLLREPSSPVFLMKNKPYIIFNSACFTPKTLLSV